MHPCQCSARALVALGKSVTIMSDTPNAEILRAGLEAAGLSETVELLIVDLARDWNAEHKVLDRPHPLVLEYFFDSVWNGEGDAPAARYSVMLSIERPVRRSNDTT